MNGWNRGSFSQAVKDVLIRSVKVAIPMFVIRVFLLPKEIYYDIERMLSSYWWDSKGNYGIRWMCWQQVCYPKYEGGLGFKRIRILTRL